LGKSKIPLLYRRGGRTLNADDMPATRRRIPLCPT
jgi:hypothetical protein